MRRKADVSTSANGGGLGGVRRKNKSGTYKTKEAMKGRTELVDSHDTNVIGTPVVRVGHEAGGGIRMFVTGELHT